jgi:undecaprenyl-diphosphatase
MGLIYDNIVYMSDLLFIFGAKYLFIFSLLISGIYFLKQPFLIKKKMIIFALVSLPMIYSLALFGGHLYNNPRPFVVGNFTPLIPHTPDNGFPSDHVLMVSAVSAILLFFNRRIALFLWVITLLVAISRVYVGVHHPIDVIGSALFSIIGSCIAYLIIKNTTSRQEN